MNEKKGAHMIWLAVIIGCFVVSFMFSGIEAGLLSVNRVRLATGEAPRRGAAIKLQQPARTTPSACSSPCSSVTNLMTPLRSPSPRNFGEALRNHRRLLSLAVALPVYMLGIELLPKSFFRRASPTGCSRHSPDCWACRSRSSPLRRSSPPDACS